MRPRLISEQEFQQMRERVGCAQRVEATTGGRSGGDGDSHRPSGADSRLHKPPASPSRYRSKWEAAYASKLEQEKRVGLIKAWWYEPFSLWLPGKIRYKPDFMVQMNDPRFVVSVDQNMPTVLELIEVKGWSRNRRDGITRLKIAAALFPCFVWRLVYRTKGGGWNGEYV